MFRSKYDRKADNIEELDKFISEKYDLSSYKINL